MNSKKKDKVYKMPIQWRIYILIGALWFFAESIILYGIYMERKISTAHGLLIIVCFLSALLMVIGFKYVEISRTKDIHALSQTKQLLEIEIGERRRAEEALKESELRYRNIVENTDNAIAVYEAINNGEDFIIMDFNKAAERIEELKREDIIGKPVTEVFPAVREFGIFEVFRRVWETGNPEEFPLRFYKDERLAGWRDNFIYKLPGGEVVAVYSDETERMKAQEEREELIKELGAQNAELEQFSYMVSHDLKSPLITIKGFLGLLGKDIEKNDADTIKNDILRIYNAAERMQHLLDELLGLSRIGRIASPRREAPFADIVRGAMESVAGRLAQVNAKIDIASDLPNVYADSSRIREMLVNLLDNALKFGDKTDMHIEIGMRKDCNENVFYVRDNGTGIDPAHHERIFGLFKKLDPRTEGSGAGLAIVKRIVEVHGGRVWVESAGIGKGSTFCFTLPGTMEYTI